ncbi:MAG: hypothetical protein ACLFP4_05860 [Spirochaetales bacterium]
MRVNTFLLLPLLLLPLSGAVGAEFGVSASATSDSVVYGTFGADPKFDQLATAELSLFLAPDETADLTVRGSYEYLLSGDPYYFSLDELRYTLRSRFGQHGSFEFAMGRFEERDPTGLIFHETVDGFLVSFGLPGVHVSATAGYTGLVFEESSSIVVSIADALELQDDDPFGPPRLYVAANGEHQLTDAGLTLGFGLAAQFDLHDRDDLAAPGDSLFSGAFTGPVQTQYQSVRLFGPIHELVSLDLFGSMVTGSMLSPNFDTVTFEKAPILGFLTGATITATFDAESHPTISAGAVFASGDDDSESTLEGNTSGYATSFVPISTPVRVPWSRDNRGSLLTTSVFYSNLLLAELSASIRPFGALSGYVAKNTTAEIRGAAILRTSEGEPPISDVLSSFTGNYLGAEAAVGISVGFAPFADLQLDGGLFFPNEGAFLSSDLAYVVVGSVRVAY